MDEIDRICAGLSDTQRHAVLRGIDWMPAYNLSASFNGYEGARAAKSSKLFHSRYGMNGLRMYKLNDLGTAVRARLAEVRS